VYWLRFNLTISYHIVLEMKEKSDYAGTEDYQEQVRLVEVIPSVGECFRGVQGDGIQPGQFLSVSGIV
jgi:hypothetical protein